MVARRSHPILVAGVPKGSPGGQRGRQSRVTRSAGDGGGGRGRRTLGLACSLHLTSPFELSGMDDLISRREYKLLADKGYRASHPMLVTPKTGQHGAGWVARQKQDRCVVERVAAFVKCWAAASSTFRQNPGGGLIRDLQTVDSDTEALLFKRLDNGVKQGYK